MSSGRSQMLKVALPVAGKPALSAVTAPRAPRMLSVRALPRMANSGTRRQRARPTVRTASGPAGPSAAGSNRTGPRKLPRAR